MPVTHLTHFSFAGMGRGAKVPHCRQHEKKVVKCRLNMQKQHLRLAAADSRNRERKKAASMCKLFVAVLLQKLLHCVSAGVSHVKWNKFNLVATAHDSDLRIWDCRVSS